MRTERRLKSTVSFKKFLVWYIKWLGITFGCASAFLVMALMVLLFVGKAVENHQTKVDLIRSGQYVEPDFQETWNKKASAATLTKNKYPKEIITQCAISLKLYMQITLTLQSQKYGDTIGKVKKYT